MIRPRTLLGALGVLAGLYLVSGAASAEPPLATVPKVDLDRYLGRWYEVARYPNWFQRNCTGQVTATYSRRDATFISVENACVRNDGSLDVAQGLARIADPGTNAKLEVLFAPAAVSFLPFLWGDYWIIELAPDYGYAVVGEPSRRYLWILARNPSLDPEVLAGILGRLPASGYDPARLVRTGT